jgi:hypothetical protein
VGPLTDIHHILLLYSQRCEGVSAELTEEFVDALKGAITSIASTGDVVIDVKNVRRSGSFSDLQYTVTVPRAESKSTMQRFQASISTDSLSTAVSQALGAPVSITGIFSIKDLNQPTFAPTWAERIAVDGEEKISKYNRSLEPSRARDPETAKLILRCIPRTSLCLR